MCMRVVLTLPCHLLLILRVVINTPNSLFLATPKSKACCLNAPMTHAIYLLGCGLLVGFFPPLFPTYRWLQKHHRSHQNDCPLKLVILQLKTEVEMDSRSGMKGRQSCSQNCLSLLTPPQSFRGFACNIFGSLSAPGKGVAEPFQQLPVMTPRFSIMFLICVTVVTPAPPFQNNFTILCNIILGTR